MIPRIARLASLAALKPRPLRLASNATFRRFGSTSPPSLSNASRFSSSQKRIVYTVSAAVGGSAFVWWDDQYNDRTVTRNFRTAYHGIMIALDYKLNFDPNALESINALHERAAGRLLEVCEKNGCASSLCRQTAIWTNCVHRGLYVKLAQALATQGPFLPAPYLRLGKLLDDAEHFDYDTVRRVS